MERLCPNLAQPKRGCRGSTSAQTPLLALEDRRSRSRSRHASSSRRPRAPGPSSSSKADGKLASNSRAIRPHRLALPPHALLPLRQNSSSPLHWRIGEGSGAPPRDSSRSSARAWRKRMRSCAEPLRKTIASDAGPRCACSWPLAIDAGRLARCVKRCSCCGLA